MEVTGYALVDQVIFIVANSLALAIAGLIVALLNKLGSYVGIKIDGALEEKVKEKATDYILQAEEGFLTSESFKVRATELAKKLYNSTDSGKAKLAFAVTKILSSFPNVSKEEAEDIIQSLLPTLAEAGVGGVAKKLLLAMESVELN